MKTGKKNHHYWIVLIFVFVLSSGGLGYGQEPESGVRFDCNDIGVEARRLIAELEEERGKLKERRQSLDEREEQLKILQTEVDNKLKRLTELRKELDQLTAKKEEVEVQRVKKLSKIYQKRDPASAAETLASMQKDLAVSILSMMRDKSAGKILDEMDKKTAIIYSTAMGRPMP
jgi:flagellar motility protein MotE (MotC chaperone)